MNSVKSEEVQVQSVPPTPVGVVGLRADGKWLKIVYIDHVANDEWVDAFAEATIVNAVPTNIVNKFQANSYPQGVQIAVVRQSNDESRRPVLCFDWGTSNLHNPNVQGFGE